VGASAMATTAAPDARKLRRSNAALERLSRSVPGPASMGDFDISDSLMDDRSGLLQSLTAAARHGPHLAIRRLPMFQLLPPQRASLPAHRDRDVARAFFRAYEAEHAGSIISQGRVFAGGWIAFPSAVGWIIVSQLKA